MTKDIADCILKLRSEAEDEDFSLHWQEIESDNIVIVANPEKQKACFIASGKKNNSLISYIIHIKKFLWAEEEGFTREDMVSKLGEQVFEEIPVEEIIANLK